MSIFKISKSKVEDVSENKEVKQTEQPETVIEPKSALTEDTSEEKEVVVLDGPLSRIYTQALNIVYANEDLFTMISDKSNPDSLPEPDTAKYVFIASGKEMDIDEVVRITKTMEKARAKGYKETVLVLEGVNDKSGMLVDLMESKGINVLLRPEHKTKKEINLKGIVKVGNDTTGG